MRRFTFTTLAEKDRALPTRGASLSQLKRPFCTQCASSSFSGIRLSIKKTDYPLLKKKKRVKRRRKAVTLEPKILVIRKMEAGEKRADVL